MVSLYGNFSQSRIYHLFSIKITLLDIPSLRTGPKKPIKKTSFKSLSLSVSAERMKGTRRWLKCLWLTYVFLRYPWSQVILFEPVENHLNSPINPNKIISFAKNLSLFIPAGRTSRSPFPISISHKFVSSHQKSRLFCRGFHPGDGELEKNANRYVIPLGKRYQ